MKSRRVLILVLFLTFLEFGFINAQEGGQDMRLSCPEFHNNGFIPKKFTCQGLDISPALIIQDLPKETKSLALIVDDPDASIGTWVHWIVFDIPPVNSIKENSIPGKQGSNSSGENSYQGPCPPQGTHRYFFKIYALDKMLNLNNGITKGELIKAMDGHILGQAEFIGLYKK